MGILFILLRLLRIGLFWYFLKNMFILCNCCCYLKACVWLGWLLPTSLSRMKVESQPLISMLGSRIAARWKSLERGRRYIFPNLNFHTFLLSVSGKQKKNNEQWNCFVKFCAFQNVLLYENSFLSFHYSIGMSFHEECTTFWVQHCSV